MNKWMACQQDYMLNFRQCLANMRKNGTFADVTLVCDGMEFSAHWIVLTAGSPYFAGMIGKKPEDERSLKVELEGLNSKGLETVLQFLYMETPEVQANDPDVVTAVLGAATMMEVQALLPYCYQILLENLSLKNFVDVWDTAEKFAVKEVADNMVGFLAKHFTQICTSSDFVRLSLDRLKAIITSPDLQLVSSDVLLRAVLTWAKHDPQERKRQVIDLIPMLDLSSLSNCYWQSVYTTEFVVRCSFEFMQTLQHAATKKRFQLVAISKKNKKYNIQSYDYVEQTWSLISEIPYAINQGCTYISYMSGIYFIGGEEEKGVLTSTVLKYDVKKGKITHLVNMHGKRWKPAAAELKGKLYVLGGIDQNDRYSNTMECFDPIANAWSYIASPKICRWNPVIVSMCGYLYLLGGYEVFDVDNAANSVCLVVEKYDSYTNTWKIIAQLPREMESADDLHITACMAKICIMANIVSMHTYDVQSNAWSVLDTENGPRKITGLYSYSNILDVLPFIIAVDNFGNLYELDLKNGKWTNLPGCATFRKIHGCVPVLYPVNYQIKRCQKTKLMALGESVSFQHGGKFSAMQYFSTVLEKWSSIFPVPFEVTKKTKVVSLRGDLYAFVYRETASEVGLAIHQLSASSSSATLVPAMDEPRDDVALIVAFEKIFVVGGRTANEERTNLVDCYNPRTEKWGRMAPMTFARANATGATLNNKIFVAGGSEALCTVERYDVFSNQWSSITCPFEIADTVEIRCATCHSRLYVLENGAEKKFRVYNPEEEVWHSIDITEEAVNTKQNLEMLSVAETLPYLFVKGDDDLFLYDISQRTLKNIPRPQLNCVFTTVLVPG